MQFVAAGLTQRGHQRTANEDAVGVFPSEGVVVVCDGMGGSAAGTFVPPVLVSGFRRALTEAASPIAPQDRAGAAAAAVRAAAVAMNRAVIDSNAAIGPLATGAGAAACALWLREGFCAWAHAGDTMLFLWRAGRLTRVWREHSLLQELAGSPELEEALRRDEAMLSNVITRAFGAADRLEPDAGVMELRDGDVLLAATDGVWKQCSDALLADLLREGRGVEATALALFDALDATPWNDNAAAVLVRVESARGASSPTARWASSSAAVPSPGAVWLSPVHRDAEAVAAVVAGSRDAAEAFERLCTRGHLPDGWASGGARVFATSVDQVRVFTDVPDARFAAALGRCGAEALATAEALAREARHRLRPWGFVGRDRVIWLPLPGAPSTAPRRERDLADWAVNHSEAAEVARRASTLAVPAGVGGWRAEVARTLAGGDAWRAGRVVPEWNRAVMVHPYADLASPWEPMAQLAAMGFLLVDVSPDGLRVGVP